MVLEFKTLDDRYSPEVIALILNIQQNEFNIPISIEDQPDLLTIERFYVAGGGNFWGAFVDGVLVGTIALIKFDNDAAAIRKMFVKKEFRGKEFAIAQRLLDVLAAYCREHGIRHLYLGTVSVLTAAQRFYERNLFEKIEKTQLPTNFPVMRADNVFYKHTLV